jgi:hypothetical protein
LLENATFEHKRKLDSSTLSSATSKLPCRYALLYSCYSEAPDVASVCRRRTVWCYARPITLYQKPLQQVEVFLPFRLLVHSGIFGSMLPKYRHILNRSQKNRPSKVDTFPCPRDNKSAWNGFDLRDFHPLEEPLGNYSQMLDSLRYRAIPSILIYVPRNAFLHISNIPGYSFALFLTSK